MYTFLSWRSSVSTLIFSRISEPSQLITGQKLRNSLIAWRSLSVVLPARVEIFAVSASTLSVRSGAKSNT